MIGLEITSLKSDLDGIGHVLRDRRLSVPKYQRSYAWHEEQVETYWRDLRSAFSQDTPGYFLGTIVLSKESLGRESVIIDGQQRLATTALLLSAVRDEFLAGGSTDRARAFEGLYLSYLDLEGGAKVSRLQLNTQDLAAFSAIALGTDLPDLEAASSKRLATAYEYFKTCIRKEVERTGDRWTKTLSRWVEFLEESVRVIIVEVESTSDAFFVFETLNDRGVALTVADLLKNYLFGVAGKDVDHVEIDWNRTIANLEAGDKEQRLLDFLRHYWSSHFGATRERDLYRSFRGRVRSNEQALELSNRLETSSIDYFALIASREELWPQKSADQATLDTLRVLRISQNWPMMLAALEHFENFEIGRLARASICWAVRGIVAGGIGGGSAERHYCDAAVRIRTGRVKDTEGVFDIIRPIVAGDDQFEAAAMTMSAPPARITRYLLRAFEAHIDGNGMPFALSVEEIDSCIAQRILPVSPGESWPEFEQEDVTSLSKRLGNFALVSRGENIRSVGRDWGEIADRLKISQFGSTSKLAMNSSWSPEQIRLWQESFAKKAVQIWPEIPIE